MQQLNQGFVFLLLLLCGLVHGDDPCTRENKGVQLMEAIMESGTDAAVVTELATGGADVNCVFQAFTPLSVAVNFEKRDRALVLLENGANPNYQEKTKGYSILQVAVGFKMYDVMDKLLEKDADANLKDKKGMTPLLVSVSRRDETAVDKLLAHGADVNIQNNDGMTPLMGIAARDEPEILDKLLAAPGIQVNAQDSGGRTALIIAAAHGQLENVQKLLDNGADKTLKSNGKTAEQNARERHYMKIAKLLSETAEAAPAEELMNGDCDSGAKLRAAVEAVNVARVTQCLDNAAVETMKNEKDAEHGDTPLLLAIKHRSQPIVEQLLAKEVDANMANKIGLTPLMAAAVRDRPVPGQRHILDELLDVDGLELNAQDNTGQTALMYAAARGHLKSVKSLIAKGAVKTIEDNEHKTASMLAAENDHKRIVVELDGETDEVASIAANLRVGPCANGNDLRNAVEEGNVATVEKCIETLDADASAFKPNMQSESGGYLPLNKAAEKGNKHIVRMLIPKVDVNAKDPNHFTALMEAAGHGHNEIVALLLENGAQTDVEGTTGSALILAAARGHTEAVKKLIAAGADVNFEDARGNTALVEATKKHTSESTSEEDKAKYAEIISELTKATTGTTNAVSGTTEAGSDASCNEEKLFDYVLKQTVKKFEQCIKEDGVSPDKQLTQGPITATPLMGAAFSNKLDSVKALISAEASVDLQNNVGWNALMLAASMGHEDVVKELLKSEANKLLTNKGGKTAKQLAEDKSHAAIVTLLTDAPEPVTPGPPPVLEEYEATTLQNASKHHSRRHHARRHRASRHRL